MKKLSMKEKRQTEENLVSFCEIHICNILENIWTEEG
jgi:hypothetical protein